MMERKICDHKFELKRVGCCSRWTCHWCPKMWLSQGAPPEELRYVKIEIAPNVNMPVQSRDDR